MICNVFKIRSRRVTLIDVTGWYEVNEQVSVFGQKKVLRHDDYRKLAI